MKESLKSSLNRRNVFFDSLKAALVFLVVFIHTLSKLTEDPVKLVAFDFIYSFVMPLFIMISGYFSKTITWEKYKKSFIYLAAICIVAQFTYFLPVFLSGRVLVYEFLLRPFGGLWYLWGLIFWRFIICLVSLKKIPFTITFLISLLVSFLYGFLDIYVEGSRIIMFLPFFVLGYYCPEDFIVKIREIKKIYSVAMVFIVLALLDKYSDIYYTYAILIETPYAKQPDWNLAILYRLFLYPYSLFVSLLIVNLIPDVFSKYGNKTMEIFLLHMCIAPLYQLALMVLHIKVSIWVDALVSVLIIMVCLQLSKIKWVEYWTNPVLLFDRK